jgi:hypothetical protein
VKYSAIFDFHFGDVPVPLKIGRVINGIVKAKFCIAEQVNIFRFAAFISYRDRPDFGVGIDWNKIRRRNSQTIQRSFNYRVAKSMPAFVFVELCLYGLEAGVPCFFAVADINVSARVILGYRV